MRVLSPITWVSGEMLKPDFDPDPGGLVLWVCGIRHPSELHRSVAVCAVDVTCCRVSTVDSSSSLLDLSSSHLQHTAQRWVNNRWAPRSHKTG